jgi:hypothetical protein
MPELTNELKREFARRLCTLPDEEKVAVLDMLAESGWNGVITSVVARIRSLNNLTDDEVFNFLSKRPVEALFGMYLPFQQQSTISCKLPNNEHTKVVVKHYECNGGSGNIHHFCLDHNLQSMKCPIDNTTLTII